MNIAITGHTSGIGLAFYNKFIQLGHTVSGFSRSNGYDISTISSSEFSQYDLFVNNAYHPIGQNRLLRELLTLWEGTDKCILNISSNIVNVHTPMPDAIIEYQIVKHLANKIVNDYKGSVKILNVLPDIVKTNFYLGGELLESGMDPDYVVDITIKEISSGVKELIIKHPSWS
jgi:short-subunit dehydrogenase